METANTSYVAVDIAKDSLQVEGLQRPRCLRNDRKEITKLAGHLKALQHVHVICEATGGYERELMRQLHAHGVRVSLVSPARVRAFAKSKGVKAKTDPIDAKMLLRFAQQNHPRPTPPPSPARQQLAALMDRREHLSEHLKREKTRRQNSPEIVHASMQRVVACLQDELARIEAQIEQLVSSTPSFKEAAESFQQVKGVGKVTAWSILAYLAEIGTLKRNEVVALAGLAPFNQDSGKTQRPRHIFGGRAKLRRCLYLAATTAARFNPVIAPYVERLQASGKPYKCAIVAAMRKLLLHLRRIAKDNNFALA